MEDQMNILNQEISFDCLCEVGTATQITNGRSGNAIEGNGATYYSRENQ